jgi:2-isopropylmalate synthase
LDAVRQAIQDTIGVNVSILDYTQHALGEGSNAKAAAYICMRDEATSKVTYGVGVSSNITRAGIRAVFSALNRLAR